MPPKVKYRKEEIVSAALKLVRVKGADYLTAREVAAELGTSVGPIFTWFSSMDELKSEVFQLAKERYRGYIELGLEEDVPFLGVWHRYIAFAREEPGLYKLLFLSRPVSAAASAGGAAEALKYSQDLARESMMRIYNIDAHTADSYFRNIWLAAFSFATLIVTGDCPYTDEEIFAIGAEISLALCKAYKDIPGLPYGDYDRDALFRELTKR